MKLPNVTHIVITGPVQCGKSIVLERIAQVLREEFNAPLVNIEAHKNQPPELEKLQQWEIDMVSKTVWILSEAGDQK